LDEEPLNVTVQAAGSGAQDSAVEVFIFYYDYDSLGVVFKLY
jgi:hypothetical protein